MIKHGLRGVAALLAVAVAMAMDASAMAAEYKTATMADGTIVTYALALPAAYDESRTYPLLLALPPGGQNRVMVEAGLSVWEREGRARGYIVASPVAPGELYFQSAARYLPELLDHLGATYAVDAADIHVSGISNGGLSAFVAALANPERFRSITVLPGFPFDGAALGDLAGLRITMFVGERDASWRIRMDGAAAALRAFGADVHYEVVPGAGHVIRSLSPARLFDLMERSP